MPKECNWGPVSDEKHHAHTHGTFIAATPQVFLWAYISAINQ